MKLVFKFIVLIVVLSSFINVCCDSDDSSCNRGCADQINSLKEVIDTLESKFEKFKSKTTKEIRDLKCQLYDTPCPDKFTKVRHSCYKFASKPRTRKQAEAYCEKLCGSHLVSINKDSEMERLSKFIEKSEDYEGKEGIHTSGRLQKSVSPLKSDTSLWIWDGRRTTISQSLNIKHIKLTESVDILAPNKIAMCAVIHKSPSPLAWYVKSADCDKKKPFICELRTCKKRTNRC